MPFKSKEDQAKSAREHYERNKELVKQRSLAFNRECRVRNRKYVQDFLLLHPCIDCGEQDPIVLEFDHVRGKKCRNISDMMTGAYSTNTIQQEIDKCDVRCANCHRRITHQRRNIAG